jgi:MFS family permease
LNPFRTLVRHRNFRLFWIGQTLSLVGTWMQTMAQGWLALELTDNAFLVGLVASVGSLPILLLSFAAGVYVDRADRLRLVILMQALMLAEAVTLWLLTVTGTSPSGRCSGSRSCTGCAARSRSPPASR